MTTEAPDTAGPPPTGPSSSAPTRRTFIATTTAVGGAVIAGGGIAAVTLDDAQAATEPVPTSRVPDGQRHPPDRDGRQPHLAARPASGALRPDRLQEGLRRRSLRCVHRAGRRPTGQLLSDARRPAGGCGGHHDRRAGRGGTNCTRCSRRSSSRTPFNAATAPRARSCPGWAASRRGTPDPRQRSGSG